jgi:hypothetical protein
LDEAKGIARCQLYACRESGQIDKLEDFLDRQRRRLPLERQTV